MAGRARLGKRSLRVVEGTRTKRWNQSTAIAKTTYGRGDKRRVDDGIINRAKETACTHPRMLGTERGQSSYQSLFTPRSCNALQKKKGGGGGGRALEYVIKRHIKKGKKRRRSRSRRKARVALSIALEICPNASLQRTARTKATSSVSVRCVPSIALKEAF